MIQHFKHWNIISAVIIWAAVGYTTTTYLAYMAGAMFYRQWVSKMDFSESGCPFMEGYILYNMIKQDAVGVWTPRTPPVAPALAYKMYVWMNKLVIIKVETASTK